MSSSIHLPVMADEVIEWLQPKPGQILVDGTLGGGGHTRLLAERVGPEGRVLGLDRDPAAIAAFSASIDSRVEPIHANYTDLDQILAARQIPAIDGLLLDLGLSSDQLADTTRGFSFESAGSLDQRFDPTMGEPAWRLLERMDERALADMIFQFGEERFSRRIARRIVQTRRQHPIRTAAHLAQLVRSCVPRSRGHRIDPATRTFQALRIAVNSELQTLQEALAKLPDLLRPGGRWVIISFHSLEDRLVKRAFREDPRLENLTRKPIRPGEIEWAANPRSRSAKLRAAQRLPDGIA
ncbi:MAG: 16S rRNA (cytosine(1402)-N(4))-methyltransferase RsmH [Planctomycetaceae bacterium]|nr:MAG: 16S rRNA (cytosine(1402)-N(4))-methyltransferase RsmH [Planctomycetaceae bacterium]